MKSAPPKSYPPSPGQSIRALRKKLGLTLGDLSARTSFAVSTLSKLEQGKASLSYDKLLTISKGLGVDMAQLLEPDAAPISEPGSRPGRRIIHRRGEGLEVTTHSYRQLYLATELLDKRFVPLMVEVRARTIDEFRAEFGDLIRHPGDEFCLVLEGEIDFHSETYAPVRLVAGDSIYFDSNMGHAYLAALSTPCRILGICASDGHDESMVKSFVAISSTRSAVPEPSVEVAVESKKSTRSRAATTKSKTRKFS
jgi:transcriptional regulator with XRE-family HTH domain